MLGRLNLLLFILFFCLFNNVVLANDTKDVYAQKGIIDLRHEDFSNNLELKGEWLFYWKKFVTPAEGFTKNGSIISFPLKWTDYKGKEGKLPSFGYATYMAKLLLPKNNTSVYALYIPNSYCAYKLFLNDVLVSQDGEIATKESSFVPHWQTKLIHFKPRKDTILLTLQVANYAHAKGGMGDPLIIGHKEQLELAHERNEAIILLLTGSLIMGGLFFLALYLVGRRDKAILFFALFSILYSYRIIGTQTYVLHSLFPEMDWYFTIRLEYISLFLGVALFALYTRYLYPKDVNKLIIRCAVLVCISFSAITLIVRPFYFSQLINPFLFVCLFCLTYTPYIYILAYKRKRAGSIYTITSSLILMLIFSLTLFRYWRFINPPEIVYFIVYIAFFFLQSLALSHRVSFVLRKARKNAEKGLTAKSEFLSTMSHEIRTPLNSVIGMTHLLLKNSPREDQKEQLDIMLFSANNLLSIVNDILDYNKIEARKIVIENIEMDIPKLAKNLIDTQRVSAKDKEIDLRLIIGKIENTVKGDPTRLYQILNNLVHNAIKFTLKGFVELGIEVKAETNTHITLHFYVKDSGIGISKEKQKIIFERFTQADSSTSRSFGGTGLGLAICKKILQLQDSDLQLESEDEKGSVFFFDQTFEKVKNTINQPHVKQIQVNKKNNLKGVSILLVEDNVMNIYIAKAFLEKWGALIDVATNGQEALEKLNTNKHQLILMDLHMPIMDGYEATRKMRAMGVLLPIIALTANLPDDLDKEIKETLLDDIIVKPFLPEELLKKTLKHLDNSKLRAES